jgi:hypothetical protein
MCCCQHQPKKKIHEKRKFFVRPLINFSYKIYIKLSILCSSQGTYSTTPKTVVATKSYGEETKRKGFLSRIVLRVQYTAPSLQQATKHNILLLAISIVMAQKTQTPNPKKRNSPATTPKDAGGSAKSQKRALKQERQSHRKHADAVMEAKTIWNKLRQKNNSKEEVQEMMEKLMTFIHGKAREIALQHDASRVVQAALQFGNDEQRKQVMEELCKDGNLFELARNQYAHFVVLKAIKYCEKNDDCVKMIVKVRMA